MTEPLSSLLILTGDTDAEMCGPDGCMIPLAAENGDIVAAENGDKVGGEGGAKTAL